MNIKSLLAATVVGDVLGSYYEGAQPLRIMTEPTVILPEELLCRILPLEESKHRKSWMYTDDTVCSLALLQAILKNASKEEFLRTYCLKYYHPLIGFGGTFKKWLENPNMQPYGSNANGCLMRVGFIPLLDLDIEEALRVAASCTNITHNSDEAINCVQGFIELCFSLKLHKSTTPLKNYLKKHNVNYDIEFLRNRKVFTMSAYETLFIAAGCVVQAMDFKSVLLNCLNVGGDTDTVAVVALNMAQHIYAVDQELYDLSMQIIKNQSLALFTELNTN